jgi:hypothetical protein
MASSTDTSGGPTILSRSSWSANESLRRSAPSYADGVRALVVHHTVSNNSYSRAQAAGIVRGIYEYHVRSNGWKDIGYNLLIDKYGTVWEGRYGGVTRAVIGAHTGGFNTNTFGVALIGTHSTAQPTTAALEALEEVVSWRLDLDHIRPTGSATLTSAGNSRHPAGTTVTTEALIGHRDLYSTACPGSSAHTLLGTVATRAWNDHGPKIAGVTVAPTMSGTTATSAQIAAIGNTSFEQWRIQLVRRSDGALVDDITAPPGASVDVTWDGSSALGPIPAADVDVVVSGTASGVAARSAVTPLTELPDPVSVGVTRPDPVVFVVADKLRDTISWTVTSHDAETTLWEIVAVNAPSTVIRAGSFAGDGRTTVTWDGRDTSDNQVASGRYRIRFRGTDRVASRPAAVANRYFDVDTDLGLWPVRGVWSPNGDGRHDALQISATSSTVSSLTLSRGSRTESIDSRIRPPASVSVTTETSLNDGRLSIRLRSETTGRSIQRTILLDRRAPRVRWKGPRHVHVSERARIRTSGSKRWRWRGPGKTRVGMVRWIVARDAAGNEVRLERR